MGKVKKVSITTESDLEAFTTVEAFLSSIGFTKHGPETPAAETLVNEVKTLTKAWIDKGYDVADLCVKLELYLDSSDRINMQLSIAQK